MLLSKIRLMSKNLNASASVLASITHVRVRGIFRTHKRIPAFKRTQLVLIKFSSSRDCERHETVFGGGRLMEFLRVAS